MVQEMRNKLLRMSKEDAPDLKSRALLSVLSQGEEGGAIFSDFVSTHPVFLLTSSWILAATLGYPCYFILFYFIFLKYFIYLAAPGLSCNMQNL